MPLPRAKKRLGQNFLVDQSFAERIVRELAPRADETVLEIGPGHGALTGRLVEAAGRVVAIEFDRDLVQRLRERFGERTNFHLIQTDALEAEFCLAVAPAKSVRVIANLPYNISTPILRRLIEHRSCITEMVLMLQREVVDRMTAPAGSSDRGFLSVFVEAYCEPEKLFDVPPRAFQPAPKVWSSIVRLRTRSQLRSQVSDEALFWRVVSAGFAKPRKTIFNNLRSAPTDVLTRLEAAGGVLSLLETAQINSQRRAETLEVGEWAALTRAIEAV